MALLRFLRQFDSKEWRDESFEQCEKEFQNYHANVISLGNKVKTLQEQIEAFCQTMNNISDIITVELSTNDSLRPDLSIFIESARMIKGNFLTKIQYELKMNLIDPIQTILQIQEKFQQRLQERKALLEEFYSLNRKIKLLSFQQITEKNNMVKRLKKTWIEFYERHVEIFQEIAQMNQSKVSVLKFVFNEVQQNFVRFFSSALSSLSKSNLSFLDVDRSSISSATSSIPDLISIQNKQNKIFTQEKNSSQGIKYFKDNMRQIGGIDNINDDAQGDEVIIEDDMEGIDDMDDVGFISENYFKSQLLDFTPTKSFFPFSMKYKFESSSTKNLNGSDDFINERHLLISQNISYDNQERISNIQRTDEEKTNSVRLTPRNSFMFKFFDPQDSPSKEIVFLSAIGPYLNFVDLVFCRRVCVSWRNSLSTCPLIWENCIKSGGINSKTRKIAWKQLILGPLLWQHPTPSKFNRQSSPIKVEKDLYQSLLQIAQTFSEDSSLANIEDSNETRSNWVVEIEMDIHRTYRTVQNEEQDLQSIDESILNEKVVQESLSSTINLNHAVKPGLDSDDNNFVNDANHSNEGTTKEIENQNNDESMSPTLQAIIATRSTDYFSQVELDLASKRSLQNILSSYAIYNPNVRYCQGMNVVVQTLLDICNGDEEDAFWLLVGIGQRFGMEEVWRRGLPYLHFLLFALDSSIHRQNPELYRHFKDESIQMGMFASSWFLTLFASSKMFEMHTIHRIWDVIFMLRTYPWGLIIGIGMAFFSKLEDELLKLPFETLIRILQNLKQFSEPKFEFLRNPEIILHEALQRMLSDANILEIEGEFKLHIFEPELNFGY